MQLPPATRREVAQADIGTLMTARPPTVRTALTGRVVEIERNTVTLQLDSGLLVAVDREDCWTLSRPRPLPT